MRHSRKAVMIERYKLYLKKHTFNGKYLVRNVQIGIGLVLVLALIVGISVVCLTKNDETVAENADINLKAALFGLDVTEETATNKEKEDVSTEAVTESQEAMTEVAEAVIEEVTTESVEAENTEETQVEESTEEPSLFDDRCIAKVDESLNIRMEPDSDSEFVGQMGNGAIAKVLGVEGDWTKIKSGDVTGYVLSDFVLTGEAAEDFSKEYVTRTGTVLEDGVNIRADRSTDAEILHVFDKGDIVDVVEVPEVETTQDVAVDEKELSTDAIENTTESITEETTTQESSETEESEKDTTVNSTSVTVDSLSENVASYAAEAGVKVEDTTTSQEVKEEVINWITVCLEDGQIGYVSDKFIEIDELYELAVSAEELQRIAEEKARAEAEEAARIAMANADTSSNSSDSSYNSNNNSSDSGNNDYEGETTTPERADSSGDCLGTFTITAYCGCSKCSGGSNRTASGTVPTEGRTIAADTSILPYGTQVVIDGIVYTVEDCGSGVCGNHIDIFFATHERALAYGRRTVKVYRY